MIFTDQKLTEPTLMIRWYKYSDPNMGWGDEGTEIYIPYPLNVFKEKENERLPKGCKKFYYTYEFNEEFKPSLVKEFGNYWWIGRGYELADEAKRLAKIKELKEALKREKISKRYLK